MNVELDASGDDLVLGGEGFRNVQDCHKTEKGTIMASKITYPSHCIEGPPMTKSRVGPGQTP